MTAVYRVTLFMAIMLCGLAHQTSGQTVPASSFVELSKTLRIGTRVRIVEKDRRIADAVVLAVHAHDLEIASAVTPVRRPTMSWRVPEEAVRSVAENDGTWNGQLVGTGVGLVAASFIVAAAKHERSIAALIFLPPIGGSIGQNIDRNRRRTLYVAPGLLPSTDYRQWYPGAKVVGRWTF